MALLIFIKNPVKGKVKTRLASTMGDDKALAIYQSLLKHTRNVALQMPVGRMLFYSERVEANDDWDRTDFSKHLQTSGDLGQKIQAAFELALKQHEKAVLIGSDNPRLSPAVLQEAFDQLDKRDVVLGPAEDGGYYLIGMTNAFPHLFEQISWSTEHVLEETLQRVQALSLSYYLLPTLPDIDYEEDWQKYGWPLDS